MPSARAASWTRAAADGHVLGIDRRGYARDGVGESLTVEQEIAPGVMDPSRVHDHARRVEYRIDVREPCLQHAAGLLDLRIKRLEQCKQASRLLAGERRETQSLGITIDVDD